MAARSRDECSQNQKLSRIPKTDESSGVHSVVGRDEPERPDGALNSTLRERDTASSYTFQTKWLTSRSP